MIKTFCDRCGEEVDFFSKPTVAVPKMGYSVITIPVAKMEVACDECYEELLELIRIWARKGKG